MASLAEMLIKRIIERLVNGCVCHEMTAMMETAPGAATKINGGAAGYARVLQWPMKILLSARNKEASTGSTQVLAYGG